MSEDCCTQLWAHIASHNCERTLPHTIVSCRDFALTIVCSNVLSQLCAAFLIVCGNVRSHLRHKTILETCDIWDTDCNSDNWEPEFMTIFVTCQLRVTVDSIRNSCDVLFFVTQIGCICVQHVFVFVFVFVYFFLKFYDMSVVPVCATCLCLCLCLLFLKFFFYFFLKFSLLTSS